MTVVNPAPSRIDYKHHGSTGIATSCFAVLSYLAAATTGLRLVAGVTVGDALWTVVVSSALVVSFSRGISVRVWRPLYFAVAFLAVTAVTSLLRLVLWDGVASDYLGAVGRGVLYIGGTAVLYTHLRDRRAITIGCALAAALHGAVGLALIAPALLPIPAIGDGPGLFGTIGLSERLTASGSVWQLKGLTSEPAYFGALQALALPLLLMAKQHGWRWGGIALWVAVASIIASQSITGIGLAVVSITVGLLYSRRIRQSARRLSRSRVNLGGIIVAGAVFVSLLLGFSSPIQSRLEYVFTGADKSAEVRLSTGWRPAVIALEESPLIGVGWGNVGSYAFARDRSLVYSGLTSDRFSWNAIALTLGSAGLVGGALFLIFLWQVSRKSYVAAVLLVAWMFTSSLLFQPMFWTFLLLIAVGLPRFKVAHVAYG